MAGLTWLHLSDWHQKTNDFDRQVVRDALIEDIRNRCKINENLETIDFIIFSGDAAYQGSEKEFKAAHRHLFQPVLEAANLQNKDLFIVPGNHDINRESFKLLPEKLTKPLKTTEEINEWLTDDKGRERLLDPFENYTQFIKAYAEGNLSPYAAYYPLKAAGKTIALLGFNSALMSGRTEDDYGCLMLGEPQVYETLHKATDADVRIAVMHHHFAYLTEADRIRVEDRLLSGVDFVLCGHQHRGEVTIQKSTKGDCVIIPAGAAYNRRIANDPRYTNAYNFVHLDFAANSGTAYLRRWDDETGQWKGHDTDHHPGGCYPFTLTSSLRAETPGPKEPVPVSPPVVHTGENYSPDNPVFNLQHRSKKEGMVGREDAMQKVRQQLLAGKPTAIGHTAAFQGLGGLGKTQLAVEYAHRYRDQYPGGVIWINADQDIDAQLIDMAKTAKWIYPESDHSLILEVALKRLKSRSDCLVIFDNVEEREIITPYLPDAGAEPHLLLTSRASQNDFVPIHLDLLNTELALQLLMKESRRDYNDLMEMEKKAAEEIVSLLDGLPLAIEIAGAYLTYVPDCSFTNYQKLMEGDFTRALSGERLSSLTGHERNLYKTLQVSEQVLKTAPLLEEILNLLAWSGSAFMGKSLMAAVLGKEEKDLIHALSVGTSLHLLHKASEGDRYDIHRLVLRVRQEQSPIDEKTEWINNVCARLGDWFEERGKEFNDLPAFEAEIDHLKKWLGHAMSFDSSHAARLTWLQFCPPQHLGKYREAHQHVQAAFSLLEKQSEPDLKLKADIFNDLSYTYGALGNNKEALKYNKQALEIRMEILGEKHPDTATSFNNLGTIYGELGDRENALKYQERALEILREIFGEKHPDTAQSISNLGSTYGELGDHENALKYKERALEIRMEILGEKHPDTAISFNNLGYTYGELGDHENALKYHQQALEIRKEILGEKHPDTATSFSNLGATYGELGDHEKELKYQQKALAIRREIFGEKHPDTAKSKNNVGTVYFGLKKYNDAILFMTQALDTFTQILGPHHPNTANTLNNLVFSLMKLKMFKEASKRLDAYLKNLPHEHPWYEELKKLSQDLDYARTKSGFRSQSATKSGKRKKKKKK